MTEFVLGIIVMIMLYFLGKFLYPEPKHKENIPEPQELDSMQKDQIVEETDLKLGASEEISDEGKEKIVEDELEKVLSNAKTMSPNEFHTKMCYVLMAMAVIGGVFSFIGYILAPDSCGDENTVFENLGWALFMMSMIGVPINIIIWLGSLFKSNVDSGQVFALVCLHTLIVILIMFVFGEYIIQDMFCNSEVFVWGVF